MIVMLWPNAAHVTLLTMTQKDHNNNDEVKNNHSKIIVTMMSWYDNNDT